MKTSVLILGLLATIGCGNVSAIATDDGGTGGTTGTGGKDGVETGAGGQAGAASSIGGTGPATGGSGGATLGAGGVRATGGTGPTCNSGQTLCGSTCVNTASDSSNCGVCGNPCSGGQTCQDSQCKCPSGMLSCNGSCVASDATHCGSCSMACATGQVCSNNSCAPSGGTGGGSGTGGSGTGGTRAAGGATGSGGIIGSGGTAGGFPECPNPASFSSSVSACIGAMQTLTHRNGYDCWRCPSGLPTECWFPNAQGLGDAGDSGLCVDTCSECN